MKRRLRDREGFYKIVVVLFFILLIIYGLCVGVVFLIPLAKTYGLGDATFILISFVLLIIPAAAGLYVIYGRLFKGTPWIASDRYYTTCTFKGLGNKREVYLGRLAETVVKNNYRVFEKSILGWMEGIVIGGADLLFEPPNKLVATGVRAVPVNGDLRVGYSTPGGKGSWAIFFIFTFLGLFVGFVPLNMGAYEGLGKFAELMPVLIFFCISFCVNSFYSSIYESLQQKN